MELTLQTLVNGITTGTLYSLVAVGFTLVFGILEIPSLTHGAFYMWGGLLTYALTENAGLPFWVALPLAAVFVFPAAAAVQLLLLRPLGKQPFAMLVLTAGVGVVFTSIALLIFGPDSEMMAPLAEGAVRFGGLVLAADRLVIVTVAVVILGLFGIVFTRTKVGRALRAVSQDREGAMMQGISAGQMETVAFGIGGGLAALAGGLGGALFFVSPLMGESAMVKAFVVVILGGFGSVMGAVVGGLALGIIESFSSTYLDATIATIVGFVVVAVVLILRPEGLLGSRATSVVSRE